MTPPKTEFMVQFWVIESREFGLFCGFRRKAKDFWLKRATFGRPGFPYEGQVMIFDDDRKALVYIRGHDALLPNDCTARLCDFDVEWEIHHVNEKGE